MQSANVLKLKIEKMSKKRNWMSLYTYIKRWQKIQFLKTCVIFIDESRLDNYTKKKFPYTGEKDRNDFKLHMKRESYTSKKN